MDLNFTESEVAIYSRQLILSSWSSALQQRIKLTHVLLNLPSTSTLLYLAALGIGRITVSDGAAAKIFEFDKIRDHARMLSPNLVIETQSARPTRSTASGPRSQFTCLVTAAPAPDHSKTDFDAVLQLCAPTKVQNSNIQLDSVKGAYSRRLVGDYSEPGVGTEIVLLLLDLLSRLNPNT